MWGLLWNPGRAYCCGAYDQLLLAVWGAITNEMGAAAGLRARLAPAAWLWSGYTRGDLVVGFKVCRRLTW